MPTRERIEVAGLPLAVYRELAAHLRQVEGVSQVEIISQTSQQFDYSQSQVEGLWLDFSPHLSPDSRRRVEQILTYYQSRYGN